MVRVRPGGYHALLRATAPRSENDHVESAEDPQPRRRLALSQRGEEGAEGVGASTVGGLGEERTDSETVARIHLVELVIIRAALTRIGVSPKPTADPHTDGDDLHRRGV